MGLGGEETKSGAESQYTPIAVIMFGSPGSGKGTQSKFLVNWLGIPQISTGDMLRDHMRRGTEIGLDISARMKAGSLVSDELVNRLVRCRISESDCSRGFILDGYPRTPGQAAALGPVLANVGMFEVVIHLQVDYNIVVSRMTGRRVCPTCGTLYNSVTRPPSRVGLCDSDGSLLAIRDDDREDIVRERLGQYEASTRPLIEFFRRNDANVFEVDASVAKPEEVFGRIQRDLLELFSHGGSGTKGSVIQ